MSSRRVGWFRALTVGGAVSLLAASCIYDPDHRCGPNQHLSGLKTCTCDDGLVLQGETCVPCGEDQISQGGVCVCKDGYTRAAGDAGTCVLGGPGTPCDLTASESGCNDPAYLVCRDHGGGIGYCTASCTADNDCPHGFSCDTTSSPASCKMRAVGEGDKCNATADCAGKDATYCENTLVHECLVSGCSTTNALSCSEGWICCDLHSLGLALTLCAPEVDCPTAH